MKTTKEFVIDMIKELLINLIGVLSIGNAAVILSNGPKSIWDCILISILVFAGMILIKESYVQKKVHNYEVIMSMIYTGVRLREMSGVKLEEHEKEIISSCEKLGFGEKFDDIYTFKELTENVVDINKKLT